jgi:hypothetical protein
MKILWKYLKGHRQLIFPSLVLAASARLLYWLFIASGIALLARLCKAAQDYFKRKAVARFGMNYSMTDLSKRPGCLCANRLEKEDEHTLPEFT